jgi:hypothetical protein
MREIIFRFVVGGLVVSIFAVLGDVLRPKSFAGLFGAAPSIALATLGLTIHQHGKQYASIEARSMIMGAAAFFVYAALSAWVLRRFKPSTFVATVGLLPLWLTVSGSLYVLLK